MAFLNTEDREYAFAQCRTLREVMGDEYTEWRVAQLPVG
jgi:hypothetical protein